MLSPIKYLINSVIMLIFTNFFESLTTLFFYIILYNFSLVTLFWTLTQFVNSNSKTLYAFSNLKHNFIFIFVITILFFSMAGVPPFLGFFSKLLILVSLININFFFLYIFFFFLLFFGLYFYIQNIRFLYLANSTQLNYAFLPFVRVQITYLYFTYSVLFILIFGFYFFEDLFFCILWLFI